MATYPSWMIEKELVGNVSPDLLGLFQQLTGGTIERNIPPKQSSKYVPTPSQSKKAESYLELEPNLNGKDVKLLSTFIESHYSKEELSALCAYVGIESENIEAKTLQLRSVEVIKYCQRHDLMKSLIYELVVDATRGESFQNNVLPEIRKSKQIARILEIPKLEVRFSDFSIESLSEKAKKLLIIGLKHEIADILMIPYDSVVISDLREGSLIATLQVPYQAAEKLQELVRESSPHLLDRFSTVEVIKSEIETLPDKTEWQESYFVNYFREQIRSVTGTQIQETVKQATTLQRPNENTVEALPKEDLKLSRNGPNFTVTYQTNLEKERFSLLKQKLETISPNTSSESSYTDIDKSQAQTIYQSAKRTIEPEQELKWQSSQNERKGIENSQ